MEVERGINKLYLRISGLLGPVYLSPKLLKMKPVTSLAPTAVHWKRVKLPQSPRSCPWTLLFSGRWSFSQRFGSGSVRCLAIAWTRQKPRGWEIRKKLKGFREQVSKSWPCNELHSEGRLSSFLLGATWEENQNEMLSPQLAKARPVRNLS